MDTMITIIPTITKMYTKDCISKVTNGTIKDTNQKIYSARYTYISIPHTSMI